MISTCRCSRLSWSPSVPGGWWRSLEKSTHGGPVVTSMMMSAWSRTMGSMSRLMVSLLRVVMSPCWIGWWWWCSTAWQSGLVSQLIVKVTLAPKNLRACDAAPMPSRKLMCKMGRVGVSDWSSCWMRGISGGGVAAVSAPRCPYCHCGEDFPFFPPLPLGCCPFCGATAGAGCVGLGFGVHWGGGGRFGCHCVCCGGWFHCGGGCH